MKDSTKISTPAYKSENAWTDLGLTLPIFLGYHWCVVFLPVRNAADWVTHQMAELASNDLRVYAAVTLAIGMALVTSLVVLGRGHSLRLTRFVGIAIEAIIYAVAMRLVASSVVGRLKVGQPADSSARVSAEQSICRHRVVHGSRFLRGIGVPCVLICCPRALSLVGFRRHTSALCQVVVLARVGSIFVGGL